MAEIYLLEWDEHNEEHLARHGITPGEVRQMLGNRHLTAPNPKGSPTSKQLIGSTDGGRILVVVIEPTSHDDATWRPVTGWQAEPEERNLYLRRCR